MHDAKPATDCTPHDPQPAERNLNLRIPSAYDQRAEAAAQTTGLKKADVFRLAIDHGIDIVLAKLKKEPTSTGGEG